MKLFVTHEIGKNWFVFRKKIGKMMVEKRTGL